MQYLGEEISYFCLTISRRRRGDYKPILRAEYIIVIELMFLGINMFLALLRAHFNPRHARAKMILSRAKNIFMPANVNSIVIFLRIRMQ